MTAQDISPHSSQDIGRPPGHALAPDRLADDDALGVLFDRSPAQVVQTSAAAETAFVLGVFALLASPFSLMAACCLGVAAVALVTSVLGLARSSRHGVSGGVLAAVGLVSALATAALIGLRYLGIDSAVGDGALPTLTDWLQSLNALLPPVR